MDFDDKKSTNSRTKNGSLMGSSDYRQRREKAVEGIMSLGPQMFSVVSSGHKRTSSTGFMFSEKKLLRSRVSANNSTLLLSPSPEHSLFRTKEVSRPDIKRFYIKKNPFKGIDFESHNSKSSVPLFKRKNLEFRCPSPK